MSFARFASVFTTIYAFRRDKKNKIKTNISIFKTKKIHKEWGHACRAAFPHWHLCLPPLFSSFFNFLIGIKKLVFSVFSSVVVRHRLLSDCAAIEYFFFPSEIETIFRSISDLPWASHGFFLFPQHIIHKWNGHAFFWNSEMDANGERKVYFERCVTTGWTSFSLCWLIVCNKFCFG